MPVNTPLNFALGGDKVDSISLSSTSLTLRMEDSARLLPEIAPASAHSGVIFTTSDESVCTVTQSGLVDSARRGHSDGLCHGLWSLDRVLCGGCARRSPGKRIARRIFLCATSGRSVQVNYIFAPEDTTERKITFSISDPSIAQISADGTLTARAAGEAVLAIFAQDGLEYDTAVVSVSQPDPTYRALVAGVYTDIDGNNRVGAANTTQGISDMLAQLSFDGEPYEVSSLFDPTHSQLMEGIKEAFAGAKSSDISLLYINTHGGLTHGTAWLRLADGSRLTAQALELALRQVPGVVVVIIDCCQSGAFIGKTQGFCDAFIQAFASSPFASSKYKVLTSSAANEDSYRISSDGHADRRFHGDGFWAQSG